jgi:hypothetical protein
VPVIVWNDATRSKEREKAAVARRSEASGDERRAAQRFALLF